MTAPEPIDPEREQGIRLWAELASRSELATEARMVSDLLLAMDRLRLQIQGLRTELSVHERRSRLTRSSTFTEDEQEGLKFALDCAEAVMHNASAGFTPENWKAMASLKSWAGVT